MDAARQLAQLLERLAQLLARRRRAALGGRRGSSSSLARASRAQRERDEALLGAVVQVALEAPALGQAEATMLAARLLQLRDAGAQLGLQALVLQRQRGGGGRPSAELGVVGERGVVDDRGDAARRRARPASTVTPRSPAGDAAPAVGVDPRVAFPALEHELEACGSPSARPARRAGSGGAGDLR